MVLSVQLNDMEEKSSSEEFGASLTGWAGGGVCFFNAGAIFHSQQSFRHNS